MKLEKKQLISMDWIPKEWSWNKEKTKNT